MREHRLRLPGLILPNLAVLKVSAVVEQRSGQVFRQDTARLPTVPTTNTARPHIPVVPITEVPHREVVLRPRISPVSRQPRITIPLPRRGNHLVQAHARRLARAVDINNLLRDVRIALRFRPNLTDKGIHTRLRPLLALEPERLLNHRPPTLSARTARRIRSGLHLVSLLLQVPPRLLRRGLLKLIRHSAKQARPRVAADLLHLRVPGILSHLRHGHHCGYAA